MERNSLDIRNQKTCMIHENILGCKMVRIGKNLNFTNRNRKCYFRAEVDKQELVTVVKFLAAKVEEMRTCHGLVEKHRHALSHSLAELETAQVRTPCDGIGYGLLLK